MNEWNIQSRAHACQACGHHFVDQEIYHTALFDQRREIHREDLCEGCWKEGPADGASSRHGFISHWQGTYEQPPAALPDPIKKENAESLLRRIIELDDPRYAAASYILAAMLERKRLLKVKEQLIREGRRVFIYEQPRTGDLFTITDPALQLNQLDGVQRDVAALLEHGLPTGGRENSANATRDVSPSDGVGATAVRASEAGDASPGAPVSEPDEHTVTG